MREKSYQLRGAPDNASQYSYTGKFKVIYQRSMGKRSNTSSRNSYRNTLRPHVEDDVKSQLSKTNVARFNENLKEAQAANVRTKS